MVSQSEIIRDLLFDNWSLTGTLAKTPSDNMKEIVYFYDRDEVKGNEQTKAIVVRKINADENEDTIIHPNFTELIDKYDITLYYRVTDVQQITYSEALTDIESMATETRRILDTVFSPATGSGPWFIANYFWQQHDTVDQSQPELQRTVRLRLSQMVGNDDKVYSGNDGTLVFDTTDSIADNPPSVDYTYQAVTDVILFEGYPQIPYLTKDIAQGRGVPYLGRGAFAGTFQAITFAHQDNMQGTTVDKFPQIYLTQNNSPQIGQQATVVLIQTNFNQNSSSLVTKSFMKILNIEQISNDAQLIQYKISGQLVKPSEVTIT